MLFIVAIRIQLPLTHDLERFKAPNTLQKLNYINAVKEVVASFGKEALFPIQKLERREQRIELLTAPRSSVIVKVTLVLLFVEALDQVVMKVVELGENEQHFEEEEQAFVETTYISDPIQDTINIAINSV